MSQFVLLVGLVALATGGVPSRRAGNAAERDGTAGSRGPSHDRATGRWANHTDLWERPGRNILSDFCNLYNFRVLHEPDAPYPFKAWLSGWAAADCNRNLPGFTGCDAIFHARSKSLDGPWEVYARGGQWDAGREPSRWRPVIAADHTYYNQWHNGDPSVVKAGGRYYMAYSSTGFNKDGIPEGRPGDADGDFLCIMGAVSGDGIHWQSSGRPILAHAEDYGAAPVGGAHLYGSYHRPSLLYDEGRFKLWFDYWTPQGASMGYAENRGDFLKPRDWTILRAGKSPCLVQWPNPSVVRVGTWYYGFADPGGHGTHPWKSRKITEAVSRNGLDWKILGYVDPDPDASATQVPEAFIGHQGRTTWLYVFYACQVGGEPYDYRCNRIRSMRRLLAGQGRPETKQRSRAP